MARRLLKKHRSHPQLCGGLRTVWQGGLCTTDKSKKACPQCQVAADIPHILIHCEWWKQQVDAPTMPSHLDLLRDEVQQYPCFFDRGLVPKDLTLHPKVVAPACASRESAAASLPLSSCGSASPASRRGSCRARKAFRKLGCLSLPLACLLLGLARGQGPLGHSGPDEAGLLHLHSGGRASSRSPTQRDTSVLRLEVAQPPPCRGRACPSSRGIRLNESKDN